MKGTILFAVRGKVITGNGLALEYKMPRMMIIGKDHEMTTSMFNNVFFFGVFQELSCC
ncbi:MAG: hypothetical protein ACTSYS_01110 [Promethearchaeota archaeon]